MKRFVLLSVFLMLAGCGDDDDVVAPIDMGPRDMPTPTDMPVADMPATDMPIAGDMGPPPVTYSGTISLLEAKVLSPAGTFFGQGLQAGITFFASTDLPAPVLEEIRGVPIGCKAWEYTAAQAAVASIGNDEGSVQITAPAGTTPPAFPACVFTAGIGYSCPETTTVGTGGVVTVMTAGATATLTDTDAAVAAATTLGRYVRIAGATNAANNGVFPIVAVGGANTIVYANPLAVAETLPDTASHLHLAGVGPIPSAADPGFLADDNTMEFALTPGGGAHFTAFTSTTAPGTVGDDFVAAPATLALLNAIPRDGSTFTLGCDAGSCGADSASGLVVSITTTDGPLTGLSPFAMPLPATKRVVVRCAALSASSITIPAAYSALLMGAGATRIQTTLIRPTLMSGGASTVSAISGHAIVGFTTP